MKLADLVGSTLLECSFGKVWVRLTFSDIQNDPGRCIYMDTDNRISDEPTARYNPNEVGGSDLSRIVYPRLEDRVHSIGRVAHGVRIDFESGSSVFICFEGDSVDSLLKLSDPKTGEWTMID